MASNFDNDDIGENASRGDLQDRDHTATAREALSALDADRRVLADHIQPPAWYYPLLAAATSLIVGSPGTGLPGQFVLIVFGSVGIVFLSLAYQRAKGLTATRTAGPRSLAVIIALGIVIVLLVGISFALTAAGHPVWVWATAAAAFVAMWSGGRLYDRAYNRELRRGR